MSAHKISWGKLITDLAPVGHAGDRATYDGDWWDHLSRAAHDADGPVATQRARHLAEGAYRSEDDALGWSALGINLLPPVDFTDGR